MKYVYPAILYPDDGKIGVTVPDLKGCHTYGDNTIDAMFMAKDAIEIWLWQAENLGREIPPASNHIQAGDAETVTLIAADTDEYRRANDNRAVKKTLSIPAWLNHAAERANAPYSQLLQEALKDYLGVAAQ